MLPRRSVPNHFTPLALPHQIRTIAKSRLSALVGELRDAGARERVQEAILDHLGIEHTA